MTRSGLLLWLSKKDIRDGLQILDLYQLYRSVPFGVFDPFHLSTAIENHPAVAVAVEATPVWESSPRDKYINLESLFPSSSDHSRVSVIAHSDDFGADLECDTQFGTDLAEYPPPPNHFASTCAFYPPSLRVFSGIVLHPPVIPTP